jgi:hypothetical protein
MRNTSFRRAYPVGGDETRVFGMTDTVVLTLGASLDKGGAQFGDNLSERMGHQPHEQIPRGKGGARY